jgi:hypothetical protein
MSELPQGSRVERFLGWLDSLPWLFAPLVLYLLVAPWPLAPESHLMEKYRFFINGTLTKPIDIFDVFYHATPMLLLSVKVIRAVAARRSGRSR